jgi:hypothetical protein
MKYLKALEIIHRELLPKNYVEIGCRLGNSLRLSTCRSIAIDPDFEIRIQLEAPTSLFKMTSDAFFHLYHVKQLLGNPIDLAFIDGMHHVECVLKDFINIEKNSHSGTVIVIDDVLPQAIEWTTRERLTQAWTGDVYQIIAILRKYRPDLQISVLDIEMKGMALITGVNPNSVLLFEHYHTIEQEIISGAFKIDSVQEIRTSMNPIPTDSLGDLLTQIKKERESYDQYPLVNENTQDAASKFWYQKL